MSRTHLLGAASAAALACFSTAHAAQPIIQGGGSTLAQYEYIAEFSIFNAGETASQAIFDETAEPAGYNESGSGAGQSAFLNDDLTCDTNKALNLPGAGGVVGACSNLAPTAANSNAGSGLNYVDYGASDATLSSTQISTWSSAPYGQGVSGNLIQLPSMGVGISFPVNNTAIVKNGDVSVSDSDLCEIFSGGYTDFSQITDSVTLKKVAHGYAHGTINVIYRGDSSGTSFLLTQHLADVCTSADTAPGFTFTATTTFASLFNATNGGGSNTKNAAGLFVVTSGLTNGVNDGPKGSSGVAGLVATTADSIAYLSPDFTSLYPKSGAPTHTLVVASALQGTTPLLPTVAEIVKGLAHPVDGTNLNPPSTAAQGANPALWVPAVAKTSAGYPVVGYTTYDFAQCYANAPTAAAAIAYLKEHFTKTGPFETTLADNGFVELVNSKAANFVTTINQHILSNVGTKAKPAWNIDINDTTTCAGKGR
jgi:ABC-type phosphate transport system substrate-binding protein